RRPDQETSMQQAQQPTPFRRSALFTLATALAAAAHGSTIVVNDNGDTSDNDGKCTLREAIAAANLNTASGGAAGECAAGEPGPTVDLIHFAIPGDGLHTIALGAALPDIVQVVTIDGYTQAGSSENTLEVGDDAVLHIEVSGAGVPGPFGEMIRVAANGTTLRGMVISHNVY